MLQSSGDATAARFLLLLIAPTVLQVMLSPSVIAVVDAFATTGTAATTRTTTTTTTTKRSKIVAAFLDDTKIILGSKRRKTNDGFWRSSSSTGSSSLIRSSDKNNDSSNNNYSNDKYNIKNSRRTILKDTTFHFAAAIFLGMSSTGTNIVAVANAVDICEVIGIVPNLSFQQPCFSGVWYDDETSSSSSLSSRVLIRKSNTVANLFINNNNNNNGSDGGADRRAVSSSIPVKVDDDKKKEEVRFFFKINNGNKKEEESVGILSKDGNKITFIKKDSRSSNKDESGKNRNNAVKITTAVWTKNSKSIVEGVYATDPRTAGLGYRVIVIRKDPNSTNTTKLLVQLNRDQAITGKIVNDGGGGGVVSLQFEFPDKTTVDGTYKDGKISFPYPVQSNVRGNTITKWDRWIKL